ncbi:MAG: hypothetical protein ACFB6S_01575 [Geminicoccaceae bacterium]
MAFDAEAQNRSDEQITPLVLKDGRIARVAVHVLPFASGDETLPTGGRDQLDRLAAQYATDCFLTAQVIGHVRPDEVATADSLDAHRLARARADMVQEQLVAKGLPGNTIASVWDWQFIVREPRVTLWVFRLSEGEDCDGEPLDSDVIASAEADQVPLAGQADAGSAIQAPTTTPIQEPPPAIDLGDAGDEETEPTDNQQLADTDVESGSPNETADERAENEALPDETADRPIDQALADLSPGDGPVPEPTTVPEPRPDTTIAAETEQQVLDAASVEPAAGPTASDAAADAVDGEIAFATNSSYFSEGSPDQLRAILGDLPEGGRYDIVLAGSVDTGNVRGAEGEEDARVYNQWLADRRIQRVQDWLSDNADGRNFGFSSRYIENDPSRRVVITIRPKG